MNNIQWFPGHMAKAKREITEKIKMIDIVYELLDARIPVSSRNPMIDEIVKDKPRLVLLSKSSMADPLITKEWIEYYKERKISCLDIDSINGYHLKEIVPYSKRVLQDVLEIRKRRGIINTQIKGLILGIPNVGKSTLINSLGNRKATKVGDRPGVTKSQAWIKINDDLLLLDTPGILWPKFEDPDVGVKLAICGSIKDEILDMDYVVSKAIEIISLMYPELIQKRYGIDSLGNNAYETIEKIGKKKGALQKGGIVDISRVETMLINDIRNVRIGAMSYERRS